MNIGKIATGRFLASVATVGVMLAGAAAGGSATTANAAAASPGKVVTNTTKIVQGKTKQKADMKKILSSNSTTPTCHPQGNTRHWQTLMSSKSDLERKGDMRGQKIQLQQSLRNKNLNRIAVDLPGIVDLNGKYRLGDYVPRWTQINVFNANMEPLHTYRLWHFENRFKPCLSYVVPRFRVHLNSRFTITSETQWVHRLTALGTPGITGTYVLLFPSTYTFTTWEGRNIIRPR